MINLTGCRTACIVSFILLFFFSFNMPVSAASGEQKLFNELKNIPKNDTETFESRSGTFLKKYPKSRLVPEVRLLQAERERDIDLAVKKYGKVVKNYPSFKKRDYAQYRLCQVLELKSRWKALETETTLGIRLFPEGRYCAEFRLMRATSLIMQEKFDACREECIMVTGESHDFDTLSRALFLLAETDKKISGNSRSYIYGIRELLLGYEKSGVYPSILFRLGVFYEERKDTDRAYSVFTDIVKMYPGSPEAKMAVLKAGTLKKQKARYVKYMPDQKTVDSADTIDIQPEYEQDKPYLPVYYSVMVGPFTRKREAERISRLLAGYEDTRIEQAGSGYIVFTGMSEDTDGALNVRIRLAEEFGLNGQIVRFSEKKSRSYIYGD